MNKQEIIKYIDKHTKGIYVRFDSVDFRQIYNAMLEVKSMIKELDEWVDVRDRLPSEEDLVKAGQYGFYITVQCGKLKRVEEADYDLDTKEWNYNREFCGEEVIAWRYELRPYERKEREND